MCVYICVRVCIYIIYPASKDIYVKTISINQILHPLNFQVKHELGEIIQKISISIKAKKKRAGK